MPVPSIKWERACKVSLTSSGFPSTIPTITAPVGDGVHVIANGETTLELYLFGAGSDNDAFDARIIGWSPTIDDKLWLPDPICEVTATRSAVIGVALMLAIATDRFADTIVVNKGVGVASTVTADAEPSRLIVDITGFDRWQLIGNLTAGTNMNAFFRQSGNRLNG